MQSSALERVWERRRSKRLAESLLALNGPTETPAKLRKRELGSEPTSPLGEAAAAAAAAAASGPKPETSRGAFKRRSRMGVSLLQKKPFAVARRHAMPPPPPPPPSLPLGPSYWLGSFPVAPAPPTDASPPGYGRSLSHTSASSSSSSFPSTSARAPSLSSSLAAPFHEYYQEQQQNSPQANGHLEVYQQIQSHCENQMDLIKSASRLHSWHWDDENKSHECVVSNDKLEVCFHPECSESAAAIIGSQPLKRNGNYYYWEVTVFDKTYGTSVMFGLCTKQQQLHANDYCNLIGLDKNGWSLSHKGLIWHDGKYAHYTRMFPPNQTVTIGLLFNTMRGELSYFMDGVNMGVAFCGLNDIAQDLYPVVGSTAKCTRMKLLSSYCGYVSLLERSCFTLLKRSSDKVEFINYLKQQRVPKNLVSQLAEIADAVCGSQTKNKTDQNDQYSLNNDQQLIKD